jgi:hypothetical protein
MGKLKAYDCHKQKYYVPQDKPKWAVLNLKQAAKKIDKEKSSAKKQVLGKKARVALKLANRKGGRGVRNPANPDFKKNLEKVRRESPLTRSNPTRHILGKPAALFHTAPPPPSFVRPARAAQPTDGSRLAPADTRAHPLTRRLLAQAKNFKKQKRSDRKAGKRN